MRNLVVVLAIVMLPAAAHADELADHLHDCQKQEAALGDTVAAIAEAGEATADVTAQAGVLRVRVKAITEHCGLIKIAARRIAALSMQRSACQEAECDELDAKLARLDAAIAASLDGYRTDLALALAAKARIDALLTDERLALAAAELETHCKDGDPDACVDLGDHHDGKRARKYYTTAVRLYGHRCRKLADADACETLADAYATGELGLELSDRKAERLWDRADKLRAAAEAM